METITQPENSIHFDSFEFNLRTRELFRDGTRLKIRGHPVDVLAILLENPGELVSREELKKRLWPADTFVDFEQILNNSMVKLRDALGDRAESPTYIETMPRLGYRFIAHLDHEETNHEFKIQKELIRSSTSAPFERSAQKQAFRNRILWLISVTLLVISIVVFWFLRTPPPPLTVTHYEQLTLDGTEKHVIGTDGVRLYLSARDPRFPIAQIPVTGGSLTRVPIDLPPEAGPTWRISDISPDGSTLLITGTFKPWQGNPVWMVGAAGHLARYMTEAFVSAFSPDGRNIIFANAHGEIYAMATESDIPRLLYQESSPPEQVVFTQDIQSSPDGSVIRFTRRGRGMTIWEIDSSGQNPHEWLSGWNGSARKCCGRWTPDGRFFIFLTGAATAQGPASPPIAQIWAYDEKPGTLHLRVENPFPLALGPLLWGEHVPSRDGKKIYARGISLRGELERYDRKSNRLVPILNGISAEMLDFSRDGRYVAYVSFPEGILWRANRNGSGAVQLTKLPLYARNPRWSPDATKILFTGMQNGVDHLYVISSGGGLPKRILPHEDGPLSLGDWSPDGKKVVSTTFPLFGLTPVDEAKIETRIIELETGKIVTLPNRPGGFWAPLWSPDGRYIAGHPRHAMGLALFDLETQKWKLLPPNVVIDFHTWSHDGKFLYFCATVGDKIGVYRIPVDGGKEELVFDFPEDFRGTGWYNFWMSLDPGDVPIVFRNVGTDEIYALTLDQK